MSTTPNGILQSVIYGAEQIFRDVSTEYVAGMLKGQILAAKHIGPVDDKLLNEAIAAVDALRPKKPASK